VKIGTAYRMCLVACVVAGVAATMAVGAPWHTYHGDFALNGVSEARLDSTPTLLWRARVGSSLGSSVVGGGGRLFCLADGEKVTALDMEGGILWARTIEVSATSTGMPPVAATFTAPPLYVDDALLVVVSDDGDVYGLSPADGRQKWHFETGDAVQGTPNFAKGSKENPARVIVITKDPTVLYAIDPATGGRLWESDDVDRTDGHIAVEAGRVVFGNCSAGFVAVDVATGKEASFTEVGESCEMAGGVAADGSLVFGGNRSGSFACGDVRKGELVWLHEDGEGEVFTTPALTATRAVYCGGNAVIYAVDRKTGATVWTYDTGGMQPVSPIVAGTTVLGVVDGTLFGLKLEDGTLLWKLEAGDEIAAPSVVDGRLVLSVDDGHVAAYGVKEAK
jgi:outer membrane protein assembly factor BamB